MNYELRRIRASFARPSASAASCAGAALRPFIKINLIGKRVPCFAYIAFDIDNIFHIAVVVQTGQETAVCAVFDFAVFVPFGMPPPIIASVGVNIADVLLNIASVDVNIGDVLLNIASVDVNIADVHLNIASVGVNIADVHLNIASVGVNIADVHLNIASVGVAFLFYLF
jgi:hypothetical protein